MYFVTLAMRFCHSNQKLVMFLGNNVMTVGSVINFWRGRNQVSLICYEQDIAKVD